MGDARDRGTSVACGAWIVGRGKQKHGRLGWSDTDGEPGILKSRTTNFIVLNKKSQVFEIAHKNRSIALLSI